jgi:hypothetical protein
MEYITRIYYKNKYSKYNRIYKLLDKYYNIIIYREYLKQFSPIE